MGFENFNYNKPSAELSRRHFLKIAAAAALTLHDFSVLELFNDDKISREKGESKPDGKKKLTTEQPNVKNLNTSKKEVKTEIKEPREVIDEILRTFNSSAISSRIDSTVMSSDFLMALQFQESRFNHKAESKKGAQGIFQDKPEATQEVVEYLASLRKKGMDTYTKKPCDYRGPDSISFEKAFAIGQLLKEKSDYGRAVGKLYLLAIHDKESKFNNFPNPDVFRNVNSAGLALSKKPKTIKEQQDLLALSYHDGPSRRLNPKGASKNGKEYLALVHGHMGTIESLRARFESAGMSRKNDYAISILMNKLDQSENKKNPEAVIRQVLLALQKEHIRQAIIHKPDKVLASHEIDFLIKNI